MAPARSGACGPKPAPRPWLRRPSGAAAVPRRNLFCGSDLLTSLSANRYHARLSQQDQALMAETQTPADLAIHPRDIAFGRGSPPSRWWLAGDPIATAFFNALSASFPQGERFFMDAVRPYRDVADPKLREQIAAFLAQEAVHSREHLVFNKNVGEHGYDFAPIDNYLKSRFDFGRKLPLLNQLCATIALEHFTAILAHALLSQGDDLAGAPARSSP